MHALMSGLGAVIVLALCGLSGFVVVADERRDHGAEAAGRDTAAEARIDTRAADARPLSIAEVFPGGHLRVAGAGGPYAIGTTHRDADCPIAATGLLGPVLAANRCNQVVRAAITAPYGGYPVTAGILNLPDAATAAQVAEQARRLVEAGQGTFAALATVGSPIAPPAQPLAQVGWYERGHYLLYCVISRPDGQVVRDDDPYAARIIRDLLKSYLGEQVVGRRAAVAP